MGDREKIMDTYKTKQDDVTLKNGKKICILVGLGSLLLALAIFAFVHFGSHGRTFDYNDEHHMKHHQHHHHHKHHHKHHGHHRRPFAMKDRPPYQEKAKMARYLVHKSQWGVLTTFCTHNKGYPWGEVVSISDGLENESTGIPLIYISVMDVAAHDLELNPMASFTFSDAQSDWCRIHDVDPEDPRCTRVHLFGKMVKLSPKEIPDAKRSMFTKHPVMEKWPASHHFFFAKMNLTRVEVLDYFGPLAEVSVDDYLKVKL